MQRKYFRNLMTLAIVAVASICFTNASASAALVMVDSAVMPFNTTANTPANFDSAGSDKLIVTVGTENKNGGPNHNISGVTFGGVPMVLGASQSGLGTGDQGGVVIYYLDNPVGVGDVVVQVGGENGGFVTVSSWAGTLPGLGATSNAANNAGTISLATTAAGSTVLAAFENSGNTANAGTPTPDAPLQLIASGPWARNWGSSAAGYEEMVGVGVQNYSFTSNASNYAYKLAAVEILSANAGGGVPEPATATLALLGLGGLMMRRRRNA